ncbi:hypothetical protein [Naasia sp. SYSU D00948]|uniref:hypothetical protein n=1 Tax=Naasia sp. SYSU D00948 TaxID=2817379 RepID=UPI001B308B1E|nr:hypothetical protein [Naasia sp. SYSU D00948]
MADPHIAQECSIPLDQVAAQDVADATLDFGDGAVVVTCVCGAWVIEDASGGALAWSETVTLAALELAGAA